VSPTETTIATAATVPPLTVAGADTTAREAVAEACDASAGGVTRSPEERWPDARRLWRAFMLAPSIEVCEALLRGESVPVSRLDPLWVRRFGIKDKETR